MLTCAASAGQPSESGSVCVGGEEALICCIVCLILSPDPDVDTGSLPVCS